MSKYTDMKRTYDETGLAYFSMAMSHLLDIGWRRAEALTDEVIAHEVAEQKKADEQAQAEGTVLLLTPDFIEWILIFVRDWATKYSPVETMQFIEKVRLYDTKYFK